MVHRALKALGILAGVLTSAVWAGGYPEAGFSAMGNSGLAMSTSAATSNLLRADYPAISAPDSLIRLSAGDQLRLRWWGVGSGDLDLVVDTRGDLVIPDMGRIPVRNRNFRQIRDSIESMLKRRIKPNLIDIQVVQLKKAVVRVSGVVPRPGLYDCPAGTHVSQALRFAGFDLFRLLDSLSINLADPHGSVAQIPSLRKIQVIRGDADTIWVDLMRALRVGDPSQDPLLFDGDAIRILPRKYVVSVASSAYSGYLEMLPGESVSSLLAVVGESDSDQQVELMNSSGVITAAIPKNARVDTGLAMVRVSQKKRNQMPPIVWVIGQVSHPGAYPFSPGLNAAEALKLAGGILGGDDSGVAISTKKGWSWLAAARERSLVETFQIPELRVAMMDYLNHMRGNYSDPLAQLQIGDTVMVYKSEQVVWVAGKVNRPGFVTWKKGGDVAYYVAAAGGFAPRAWQSRTQVFDWQTAQPMGLDQPIRPGAAVVIPEVRFIAADQWFSIAATTVSLLIAVFSLTLQVTK